MAVWSTAYVNDLPDSAFLYVRPGGRKDEQGKTVPRDLRMFPYRDASGAVDLPHLRNALARIPQSDLPADVRERLAAKARALLEQATRQLAELETEDLAGVDIVAAVGPIHGHGSPAEGDRLTIDDLRDFEASARALAGEVRIPVKIGHSKEQRLARNSGLVDADEQPALGWVENVRVEGAKLLADLRAVPKRLADLIRAGAFRTRSVEFQPKYVSQRTGQTYRNVLTGLALLGARAPAVKTLDDIVALYGDDQIDDTETRTYDYAPEPAATAEVRLAVIGPDEVVVPLELLGRISEGRADTGGDMPALEISEDTAKKLAELLGVDGELDEAKLLETVEAREKELADAKEAAEKTTGGRQLSEDELEQLREKAAAGERAERKLYEMERDRAIEKAIREGRVEPSQRERLEKLYDASREETVKLLAELPVNEVFLRQYGADADGLAVTPEEADKAYRDDAAVRLGIPAKELI